MKPSWWATLADKPCHYCGITADMTWDHIVPKALGGTDGRWNAVPACRPCNAGKSHNIPSSHVLNCGTCQRAWVRARVEGLVSA